MNLTQIILDSFQVSSLLLVFITVFFDVKHPQIIHDLNKNIPTGKKAREKENKRLFNNYLVNCFPLLILSGMSLYLLLPLAIRVILNSNFKLWNFDFILTSYIFIVFWVGFVFVWIFWLNLKIIYKIIKIYKSSDPFN